MRFITNWAQLLGLGLLGATAVQAVNLSTSAQNLFDESMVIQDAIYDPAAAYLRYFYFPLAAGPHETRSSVWYAAGLLQRDRGEDRQEAVRILQNVIGGQEKNVSVQWYGDYTKYPEQPTVGTPAYPPVVSTYPTDDHLLRDHARVLTVARFIIHGTPTGAGSSGRH